MIVNRRRLLRHLFNHLIIYPYTILDSGQLALYVKG